MKRIPLLLILLANLCHAQIDIGVRLGVNAANQNISNDAVGHYSALIYGPVFGVVLSKELSTGMQFRSGLLFTTKGQLDKVTTNFGGGYSLRDRIHYIELPVSISFDLGKDRAKGVFIPVGGYFAYGVGGKSVYENKNTNATEAGQVVFTNAALANGSYGDYDLLVKRGDLGVSFGLGYKFKNLMIDFTHNIGLKNIHPKQHDDDKLIVKNLYLRFGAVYFLKVG